MLPRSALRPADCRGDRYIFYPNQLFSGCAEGDIETMTSRDYDISALLDEGFCPGAILNVTMHNFLTYRGHCSFPVGPRLNLVTGPNGSGKSAMTHAICLACAGTPRDVGREKDLKSFVSIGRPEDEQTFVEIDIITKELEVATIRRTINKDTNSSKWLFNGSSTAEKKVKTFMKEQCIDVDNLCTFMPQDRVGSFSSMSPKDKFVETLKSINEDLAIKQSELANAESAREEYRKDRDAKRSELRRTNDQLVGMRQELERLKRKEDCENLLLDYEVVKAFLEHKEIRNELKQKQEIYQGALQRLNEERDKIEPLEQRERMLRRKQTEREQAAGNAMKKQRELDQMLHRKKEDMEDSSDAVESTAQAVSTNERQRVRRELELEQLIEEKSTKDREFQQASEAAPNIQHELDGVKNRIEAKVQAISKLNDDISETKNQVHSFNEEVIRVKKDWSGLQDRTQCYLTMLQRSNDQVAQDTCRAMQFLMQNEQSLRERGALHDSIYGPVAMYCDVADAACAAMVERCVPKNRLLGFIVTNNHDAKTLRDSFKKLQIKTDVFTMSNPTIDNQRPYSSDLLDSIADLNLKYLSTELKCPDIVRSFLYTFQYLHHTVWGRANRLPSEGELGRLCSTGINNFKVFIHNVSSNSSSSGIQEFQGRISKYRAGSLSMTSSAVPSMVFIRGSASQDDDVGRRKADLEQRECELKKLIQEQNEKLRMINQQLHVATREVNDLKSKRFEFVGLLRIPKDIKIQVDSLAKKISNLRGILAMDADQETTNKMLQYRAAVLQHLEKINDTILAADKCNKSAAQTAVTEGLKRALGDEIYSVRNQLEDARRERMNYERVLEEARRGKVECEAKKNRIDQTFTEKMNETVSRKDLEGTDQFKAVLLKMRDEFPEKTIEDIDSRITNLQAEIDSIMDNEGIKLRYDELKNNADRLEVEVKEADEKFQNAESNLHDGVDKWKRQVNSIREKMNIKFCKFMERLGLRGELHINELGSIDNYEVDIRVSFRDEMDMASLSAHRHSGGERSVTTVMYLMALQGMSQSPFRVLDEINQGMDEFNERLVLDRIVSECCSEDTTAQYFLVTPKLLPALISLDNDKVTVLMVQNGPGIRGADLTFKNVVRHLATTVSDDEDEELTLNNPAKRLRSV